MHSAWKERHDLRNKFFGTQLCMIWDRKLYQQFSLFEDRNQVFLKLIIYFVHLIIVNQVYFRLYYIFGWVNISIGSQNLIYFSHSNSIFLEPQIINKPSINILLAGVDLYKGKHTSKLHVLYCNIESIFNNISRLLLIVFV